MARIIDITMPRLSDSMKEGTIVAWLKQPGDAVRMGEDIAEIETDKATMTYGADQAGTLMEIIANEGDTVALGEPIARMEVAGESDAETAIPEAATNTPVVTPVEVPAVEAIEVPIIAPATPTSPSERIVASPVARRTAREEGIDLSQVSGSGPQGRIVLSDIHAAAKSGPAEAPVVIASGEATTAAAGEEVRPASRIEKLIAGRMVLGKSAPEFPAEREVRIDNILGMRQEMKSSGMEQVPSINDFILLASAYALRQHPLLRSGWREDNWNADEAEIVTHQQINVGMAVATDTTLLVPVIRDADQLKLSQIASSSRELAGLARDGKLSPAQMQGAVFTISNLGGMGVTRFQAVLVPGQAAILAVGSARAEACWGEDGPEKHTMLSLNLTSDHRVVYGSHAAQFLQTLAELLENPLRLLV